MQVEITLVPVSIRRMVDTNGPSRTNALMTCIQTRSIHWETNPWTPRGMPFPPFPATSSCPFSRVRHLNKVLGAKTVSHWTSEFKAHWPLPFEKSAWNQVNKMTCRENSLIQTSNFLSLDTQLSLAVRVEHLKLRPSADRRGSEFRKWRQKEKKMPMTLQRHRSNDFDSLYVNSGSDWIKI